MSAYIPELLRAKVIERAQSRCEYCLLSQSGQAATFHIDHVVPMVNGGQTVTENLALACVSCSLRKAAKQYAIDPMTGEEASLFNPRREMWADHFRWDEFKVDGITAIGRATVNALNMNRALMLAIREEEAFFGRHPSSSS